MDLLRWLEGLRTDVGNVFFSGVTLLGSEVALMAVAISVFWCVNKKWGYYIFAVGFFGTVVSQFLKLVYRIPRPWVLDPSFTIVESARAEANDYSFPSGHTSNAVGTFGALLLCVPKTWQKLIFLIPVLLVPFSRLYLGVHTPLDVGVAFGMAVLLLLVFYPFVMKSDLKPTRMYILFGVMLACCVSYICYVNLILKAEDFGPAQSGIDNYLSGVKNGWSLTGALLGLLVTYIYDSKVLHFDVKAPFLGQVCKIVLGVGCVIAIRLGLGKLFEAVFPGQLFWSMIRYFLMTAVAGCVWPKTFPFWQKVGARKAA